MSDDPQAGCQAAASLDRGRRRTWLRIGKIGETVVSVAMGEAWFRRFGGFSYRPICWQGVAVLALMIAVFAPCVGLFLAHRDVDGLNGWGAAAIAAASALAGHAIVLWKLERAPC